MARASLPVLAGGGLTAQALSASGIDVSGDISVLQRLTAVLDPR